MYGLDRAGLGSLETMSRNAGWRTLFGLYGFDRHEPPRDETGAPDVFAAPFPALMALNRQAGHRFANASIYAELTPEGFASNAFETHVFEGDLGDLPLFLIAPRAEPQIDAYAAQIAADQAQAERFLRFLRVTREQYLRASTNATRIYAPDGTGHNFIYEAPDFIAPVIRDIVAGLEIMDPAVQALLDWPGEHGGLPPVDQVTPARLEAACRLAIEYKRAAFQAISSQSAEPTFENTVLAFERAGTPVERCQALLRLFASTAGTPEIRAVAGAINPMIAALDAEIVADRALFRRLSEIEAGLPQSAPDAASARLVEVITADLRHRGAALDARSQTRLGEIEARLAALRGQFGANVMAQEAGLAVFVADEARLSGLTPAQVAAASAEAERRGRLGEYAIALSRPSVWPVLQFADDRALREQVWTLWIERGGFDGENDNAPVMSEILSLRGEKAQLLGYENFADYQTAVRMAGTPERPLELLEDSWELILAATERENAALQAIIDEEGGGYTLAAHDRLYYREKLRERELGFSLRDIEPYLTLENVRSAMFAAAEAAYGFTFTRLEDVPTVAPEIEVYEARLDGEVAGVLWMDLFQREGKGSSSWASQYRNASSFDGEVLPLVALHSNAVPGEPGEPVTMPFERANVIFHEFGHTLQTLANASPYPSLGPYSLPWDYIEAPSLFHERWFMDERLLAEHLRHSETGEPISAQLIAQLQASQQFDRVFSVTLDYMLTAITDLRLHIMADGRAIDAEAVEAEVMAALDTPASVAPLLAVEHAFHTFSQQYAAGVYTYYWSDMIAADMAAQFMATPDGLYNEALNARYRTLILEAANTVPAEEAVHEFLGRDPDPQALLRRFDLVGD